MTDELATLATELAVDMVDDPDVAADPVAVELLTAVAVWLAAQEAAVGRFVTPAGTQMLSAYLIVAIVKCEKDLFLLRDIILTILVRLVADLCDAACYCLDETRIGADAFRV